MGFTKRKRSLVQGEAGNLLDYFERKKVEDPSFFYSMQLYVDDLIINIFWDDVKMITDFNLLGDGVSFDTTYQTNKNYRRMVIFGAG